MPHRLRATLVAGPAAAVAAAAVLAAGLVGPGTAGAATTVTTAATAAATRAAAAPTAASTTTTSTTVPVNPAARARAETAISARITALHAALATIQQTGWFAGSDQATLETLVTRDVTGLTALGTTIGTETDGTKLAAEARSIDSDYRVFALALPEVHLVRAIDRMSGDALPNLQAIDRDLKAGIAEQSAEGRNGAGALAAVSGLDAQISIIGRATTGTAARLLALTPARWNADHQVVSPYRAGVAAAVAALDQAGRDIQTALQDLR